MQRPTSLPRARLNSLLWLALPLSASCFAAGCSSDEVPPNAAAAKSPAKAVPVANPPVEQKPDPAAEWKTALDGVQAQLEKNELDDARTALDALKAKAESEAPPEEAKERLATLEGALAGKFEVRNDERRAARLVEARELMGRGNYEDATQALNDVRSLAPTTEQRTEASAIAAEIESRRSARRRLATWMQLLASDDRKEVRTAQSQLHRDADTALPLLLEAVQSEDNPALVANTLELLRRIGRPEVTMPAILGVLARAAQERNWEDAVRELGRLESPGAGEPLLELALNSEKPGQRQAALEALSTVPDPPPQTLTSLLPMLLADGPELAAALRAAEHAIRVHGQFDLVARRGFATGLTPEQQQQLGQLPQRLTALASAEPSDDTRETARAARALAVTARLLAAEPLEDVKVLSFGAESEDGRAAAVLDGVWTSTELPSMWRHAIDRRSTLILDLGAERTVTGVRLWNFNQPGGTHRGWKEVDVYVTSTPTALTPVATGILPPAPGVADTPDYSSVVPVPSVRGRYVTLQAKSVWRPDTYMGLAEVQVLGF